MTIPDVTLTVQDNQLGTIASNIDGARVLLGVCSAGVANQFYSFGTLTALRSSLGTGPLVEAAAYEASIAGGPIYCVPVNPSVVGVAGGVFRSGVGGSAVSAKVVPGAAAGGASNSAVTATGTGTSVMTVSGTTNGNYSVRVKVVLGGARGTATVQYSLDGGISFSGTVLTAASVALSLPIATGLTVAFTAASSGDFVAGDTYDFTAALHGAAGSCVVSVTGTPAASVEQPDGAYAVAVKFTLGGNRGTSTFQFSLDGGLTYNGQDIVTAATYVLADTGLTLAFSNASATLNDTSFFWAAAAKAAGSGAVSVAGSPLDSYQVQVVIVTTGTNLAAATGVFQYSLDQGNTLSPQLAIPTGGSYAIPSTGLTITFADGAGNSATYPSFSAGDIFQFDCVAPGFVTADLNTALTATLASQNAFSMIHVVGVSSSAAATRTLAGAVSSILATATTNKQFLLAVIEAADDTDTDLQAQFSTFVDYRISVAAGFERLTSPLTGAIAKRPSAWPFMARISSVAVSEDPGYVARGALPGVQSLFRDERVTPGLDAARFTTLRSFPQRPGFYVTSGEMMETPGGDFALIQFVRVMNKACTVAYNSLLNFLNTSVRVNAANVTAPSVPGGIQEKDARRIEATVAFALNNAITQPGDCSSLSVHVDRTVNILSTHSLSVTISVVPLGYAKAISVTIGFSNPALQLSA